MRLLIGLILVVPMMGGCGANYHSIFRSFEVGQASDDGRQRDNPAVAGQVIDAKQRAIISTSARKTTTTTTWEPGNKPVTDSTSNIARSTEETLYNGDHVVTQKVDRETIMKTCAEPSPDVFTVLSSSLAASGTFTGAANKKATAQLATALSEAGANIGLRTQTIQVLRDVMYRTCERFMNGAIDDEELQIQAARDQRLIVSILAIEQLTGAVRNAPVAISAVAEADTGKSLLEAQNLLDQSQQKLKTLEGSATKAKSEFEKKQEQEVEKQKAHDATPDKNPDKTAAKSKLDGAVADEVQKKAAFDALASRPDTDAEKMKAKSDWETAKTKTQEAKSAHDKLPDLNPKKDLAKKALEAAKKETETAKTANAEASKAVVTQKDVIKSLEAKRDAAMGVSVGGNVSIVMPQMQGQPPLDAAVAQAISDSIYYIVDMTFAVDEISLKCIKSFNTFNRNQNLQKFCFEYLRKDQALNHYLRLWYSSGSGDQSFEDQPAFRDDKYWEWSFSDDTQGTDTADGRSGN